MKELEKRITILPHTPKDFIIPWNSKFDMERALLYGGAMAGECYESEGFEKLSQENPSKSRRRGNGTAKNEHYTTHEHIHVGIEIVNFPKYLAMTLNNERQLVTSEKSARYTEINPSIDSNISELEAEKYQKWIKILKIKINDEYPGMFSEGELQKRAQENARYMVTGFAATKMNHTLPLAQLNRVAFFMMRFCNEVSKNIKASEFHKKLAKEYEEFVNCLDNQGLLDERLQSNKKDRRLSMFTDRQVETYFGDTYSISYPASIAQYAQSHRHRTIKHDMIFDPYNHEFYVPEIIKDNEELVAEWLRDINEVAYAYPQGKLIIANERASIEDLFEKTKERRCSAAQLEIDIQTTKTLKLAAEELQRKNHIYAEKAAKLVLGPRCTNGYPCDNKNCKFPGTEDNNRKI